MAYWYAIRTKPGAQQPWRERWTEPSQSALNGQRRGKGYSIASGVNPEQSVIEAALTAKGLTFYMPAEFAVVRNRRHKGVYELRRFALLKGYVFVELDDKDWQHLDRISGIQGVVANNGQPMVIPSLDLFRLRMYEQNLRAVAVHKAKTMSTNEGRQDRKERKGIIRSARKKFFPGKSVRLIWGDKVGHDATVQAWTDQDQVKVLLETLDGATETLVYPHEYLKAG